MRYSHYKCGMYPANSRFSLAPYIQLYIRLSSGLSFMLAPYIILITLYSYFGSFSGRLCCICSKTVTFIHKNSTYGVVLLLRACALLHYPFFSVYSPSINNQECVI